MPLPFPITTPKNWTPRTHLGRSANMSPDQKEILDQLDIIEQKSDFGINVAVWALNLSIVIGIVVLFVGGPVIIAAYNNWRSNFIGASGTVPSAPAQSKP